MSSGESRFLGGTGSRHSIDSSGSRSLIQSWLTIADHHRIGLRRKRGEVAGVALGPLGAEDDLEFAVGTDREALVVEGLDVVHRTEAVDEAGKALLGGEQQPVACAPVARDPVGQVPAQRRIEIDRVGIGLLQVNRVPQRRPVRVLRIGMEHREVRVGQVHHDLAEDIRLVARIIGPPGLGQLVHRIAQRLEIAHQLVGGLVEIPGRHSIGGRGQGGRRVPRRGRWRKSLPQSCG